jgi:hypothetical protein
MNVEKRLLERLPVRDDPDPPGLLDDEQQIRKAPRGGDVHGLVEVPDPLQLDPGARPLCDVRGAGGATDGNDAETDESGQHCEADLQRRRSPFRGEVVTEHGDEP